MYEWWRFQRYLICPKRLKIRIRIEKKFITSETNNVQTNLLQNSGATVDDELWSQLKTYSVLFRTFKKYWKDV